MVEVLEFYLGQEWGIAGDRAARSYQNIPLDWTKSKRMSAKAAGRGVRSYHHPIHLNIHPLLQIFGYINWCLLQTEFRELEHLNLTWPV